MENIYHVWVLIILAIIIAAFVGYKLAMRSNRRIQRCVHFTASTPTGRVIRGHYYFKGNNVPEHVIKFDIQNQLELRGWVASFISFIHIANFEWDPKSPRLIITSNNP
jgi:hypothetical protein